MSGVVVVGAGECGVRAAFALREAGHEGAVTIIGEEPHLPYERPPLSKNFPVAQKAIASEDAYAAADVTLLRGQVVRLVDRDAKRVVLADGSEHPYENLLLATGATARRLAGMEGASTLRTLDDAQRILASLGPGRRLAIVGGGFIGLELAATARQLGAAVTVVEAAPRLMARVVPEAIAAVAERRHREAGVELVLGTAVRAASGNRVELVDGCVVEADVVVAGVGSLPNTSLAAAAGLHVENGIVVDDDFRTSDPAIFAAGDCCNFPHRGARARLESWRAAQDQANHAARAMVGTEEGYAKIPWFWSDQYDLTLQVAGLPDPSRATVRRDLGEAAFVQFELAADGSLAAASGIGLGNAIAKDIRLAEMMIERGAKPDPAKLADPDMNLKSLLRG